MPLVAGLDRHMVGHIVVGRNDPDGISSAYLSREVGSLPAGTSMGFQEPSNTARDPELWTAPDEIDIAIDLFELFPAPEELMTVKKGEFSRKLFKYIRERGIIKKAGGVDF